MKTTRAYYIDWLRIIVVGLLVPHHIAITFSHLGDAYVYLPIKDDGLYFFLQSTFLNLWFMRMLFFISGISTFYALQKRTTTEYFIERCKKLLLPTVFAMLLVCPAMGYFKAITLNHYADSLLAFYPVFFQNITLYLGWAHFWFLVYLFVFSLLFLCMRMIIKNIDTTADQIASFLSKKNRILLPIVVFIVFETIFRPFYPGYQTLVNDWANFTVYLSFFLFGYIAGSNEELIAAIVSKVRVFAIIAGISTILCIFLKYAQGHLPLFQDYYTQMTYPYQVSVAFIQAIAEYSLVLSIFSAAKLYLNRDNQIYRYLSTTSFSLYIFHYLIVNLVMYYMSTLSWNHFIIYIISIVIVYCLFFLVYELIIKHIPPLRYICGIKK